ncbi:MAG: ABC transporter substrate-binding protein [Clostridia bacterium]|nr:ABC transporter substrate-binding protein [Clostridia bacterium]
MKTFSNIFLKRFLSLALVVLFAVSLCACSKDDDNSSLPTNPITPTHSYTVAVIQSKDDAENENAYRGFISAFESNAIAVGEGLTVNVTNCEGDKEKAKAAAEQSVKDGVDLIFAIGELAAKAADKATDTIPVIFAGVADPIESGLMTSCETPDKNITGVSDFTPVREQLTLIKTLCPDAKNVSGLYYTSDEDSILVATMAKKEAEEAGLKYTAYTAATKKEYEKALKEALGNGDALYISEDDLIDTYIDEIIKEANNKKIPVFSTTQTLLQKGCVATCYPDYEVIGFHAGELALIVLKDLKPISSLSVMYADEYIAYVSKKTAESFSFDLSVLPENTQIIE